MDLWVIKCLLHAYHHRDEGEIWIKLNFSFQGAQSLKRTKFKTVLKMKQ